jgi:hypothetical protein
MNWFKPDRTTSDAEPVQRNPAMVLVGQSGSGAVSTHEGLGGSVGPHPYGCDRTAPPENHVDPAVDLSIGKGRMTGGDRVLLAESPTSRRGPARLREFR